MPKDRYHRRPTIGNVARSALDALPARDTEALAQLVQRERSREALYHVHETGTKQTVHLDLDEGILKALNDYCTAVQIEPAALVENLLLERMRAPSPSALQAAFQELTRTILLLKGILELSLIAQSCFAPFNGLASERIVVLPY